MRCRGLVPKLILTLSVTICITFFIVGIILSSLFREEYYQERLKTLSGEAEVIEQVVNSFMNSETTLGELDKSISFIGDSLKADIYLIDSYGYIYSVSNEKYDYLYKTIRRKKWINQLEFYIFYNVWKQVVHKHY